MSATTTEHFEGRQTIKGDLLEEVRNIINKKEEGHKNNPDKRFNVNGERKNTITGLRVQNRHEWDDSRRAGTWGTWGEVSERKELDLGCTPYN